ncbi:MAG TPA: hypothetical protein VGS15_05730 [Candidatus Acidoferrales bacterium]|nr:hypothetical protein [Candidatus Acidoferrales bacterium]
MSIRALAAAVILPVLLLAGAANGKPKPPKPALKLMMSPASTVPSADLVKYLQQKCPNVSITLDSKESDFMLEAGGWSGHYKFTVFRKGGDAVFATSTMLLSNAVKDVCRYVNANAPR